MHHFISKLVRYLSDRHELDGESEFSQLAHFVLIINPGGEMSLAQPPMGILAAKPVPPDSQRTVGSWIFCRDVKFRPVPPSLSLEGPAFKRSNAPPKADLAGP